MWYVVRPLVLLLAAVRVARLTTTDWLGEWTYVGRIKDVAARKVRGYLRAHDFRTAEQLDRRPRHEVLELGIELPIDDYEDPGHARRWARLAKGLDCGYCLTPWLLGGLIIAEALTTLPPFRWARYPFRWLTLTLGGSYVAGHIWNRLDNH